MVGQITWSLMSRRTGGLDEADNIMPDPMFRQKEKTLWQVMTKVNKCEVDTKQGSHERGYEVLSCYIRLLHPVPEKQGQQP